MTIYNDNQYRFLSIANLGFNLFKFHINIMLEHTSNNYIEEKALSILVIFVIVCTIFLDFKERIHNNQDHSWIFMRLVINMTYYGFYYIYILL